MATKNQEIIDSLNRLIQINNDRIQGYLTASQETEEADLKNTFYEMMTTSQECRRELVEKLKEVGGTPIEGTTASGKLFRVWMDIKAAVTSKDRKAILNSCEFGEDVAVGTYQTEIDGNALSGSPYLAVVKSQHAKIKSGHDTIKRMRDSVKV